MEEVIVKDIPEFEEYQITNFGAIMRNNKLLKITVSDRGMPFVRLSKHGKYYTFSIGKLMGLTFFPEKRTSNSQIIGYKDGNNHNFSLDNLYWTSRHDAFSKFYEKNYKYSEERLRKLREKVCTPIESYNITNNKDIVIKQYRSIKEASDDVVVSSAAIIRCLKNQEATCVDLHWRYIKEE